MFGNREEHTKVQIQFGAQSGSQTQGQNSVAIGNVAGQLIQGPNSVAIGWRAGQFSQETNSIAIGFNSGLTNQPTNSIIINSSAAIVNGTISPACFIDPMRNITTSGLTNSFLCYDDANRKVFQASNIQFSNPVSFTLGTVTQTSVNFGTLNTKFFLGGKKY